MNKHSFLKTQKLTEILTGLSNAALSEGGEAAGGVQLQKLGVAELKLVSFILTVPYIND